MSTLPVASRSSRSVHARVVEFAMRYLLGIECLTPMPILQYTRQNFKVGFHYSPHENTTSPHHDVSSPSPRFPRFGGFAEISQCAVVAGRKGLGDRMEIYT